MKAQIRSAAVLGVEAYRVDVEVEVALGLPAYNLVGLPAGAVKEAGVRVRAALSHGGWKLPPRRVTINVVPGDAQKDAASFDLAIAVGVLACTEHVPLAALEGIVLLGELSLDGTLRRIAGGLPIALHARAAGARALVLPAESASEAALVGDLPVYGARTLAEVVAFLRGEGPLPPAMRSPRLPLSTEIDLSDVRGLETARRALEIAAAGGHHLGLIGPPGSGKSLLARCLPTILPPLDEREAIEVTAVYSAAGKLDGASVLAARPFRAPHHDVSVAGLVGGGPSLRPGEVTLAHYGVLFLDELPEFKRAALEALRQPLEDGRVTIVRARVAVTYPSRFSLVVAMQPCPCGCSGSTLRTCTCSDDRVQRYIARVSTPLFDRVDLHVEVPHTDYRMLRASREGESSAAVRERVVATRDVQHMRFASGDGSTNATMGPRQIRECCKLDETTDRHLEACVRRFALSGRAVHQILRVARTVADLAGRDRIRAADVAEAVALRVLDREGAR